MQINQKFLESIWPVLRALQEKIGSDFVVFGSAPLYLYGVLEFTGGEKLNDLDVVAGNGFTAGGEFQEVLFQDDSRQKLYKMQLQDVSIDIGLAWPRWEEIHARIFREAQAVDGFKFASLEVIKEWKERMVKEYGREKDCRYLEKIRSFQQTERQAYI
jgi:hypothetical protein